MFKLFEEFRNVLPYIKRISSCALLRQQLWKTMMYPMTARVAMQKKCQLSTETNNNKNSVVFTFKYVFN